MDKLYSKTALAIKGVLCAFLSPLFFLLASVINIENSYLYVIVALLPIGCLYTIPFWLSLFHIKQYYTGKISNFVIYDSAYCLAPAFLGILFTEIVYTVLTQNSLSAGLITLIFTIIFVLISLLFWGLYYIFSK